MTESMNSSLFPGLSLFGYPVIEIEDRYVPVIQLRADCPVSDEFRCEMNQWLLDTFGTRDVSTVPKGIIYQTTFGFIMRKSDLAAVKLSDPL